MRKSLCPDFARLLFLHARPYFHLCLSGLRHEGGTIRSLVHGAAHVRHAAVTTTTEKCLLKITPTLPPFSLLFGAFSEVAATPCKILSEAGSACNPYYLLPWPFKGRISSEVINLRACVVLLL